MNVTLWVRRCAAAGAGLLLASVLAAQPTQAVMSLFASDAPVTFLGWSNAYQLKNDTVALTVVPEIGGRIMGYNLLGKTNLVDIHPSYKGIVVNFQPPKQIIYYGGCKLWVAPQDWGWPPNAYWENARNHVTVFSPRRLQMASPHVSTSIFQFTRSIALAPTGAQVTFDHYMRNVSTTPRTNAIWALNTTALPCWLLAPVGATNWGTARPSFQQANDVLYHYASNPDGLKLFVMTNHPWVAALTTNLLWVMWGEPTGAAHFTAGEAPIEIWYGNASPAHPFAEFELQSPAYVVAPGERVTYTMYWTIKEMNGTSLGDALEGLRELGFSQ